MPKIETVTIELSSPTRIPGSYPPRLLSFGVSNWLHEQDGDVFQCLDGIWYIIPGKYNIQLNGQELFTQRKLQNGDYIGIGKGRRQVQVLYQADPVSDYLEAFAEVDEILTVEVTYRLLDSVVINEDGITLDAGRNFVLWGEIFNVGIAQNNSRWSVKINGRKNKKKGYASKISDLHKDEFNALLQLILKLSPFLLSMLNTGWPAPVDYDAYHSFAVRKLIIPARENEITLPDTPGNILLMPGQNSIGITIVLAIFMLFIGKLLYNPSDYSLHNIIGTILSAILVFVVLLGIFLFPFYIDKFKHWVSHRKD